MKRIKVGLAHVPLLNSLAKHGYVISDGKATKQIAYNLNRAGIKVQHGYCQDTKKVILALNRRIKINPAGKTFDSRIFDLKEL